MTDNTRIADLARECFGPDAKVEAWRRLVGNEASGWGVLVHGGVCMQISGDKAREALEAALLILAGETSLRALERAGLPRTMAYHEGRALRLETLIEDIADEWDARAARLGDIVGTATTCTGLESARCAAELRERAKLIP